MNRLEVGASPVNYDDIALFNPVVYSRCRPFGDRILDSRWPGFLPRLGLRGFRTVHRNGM